jgi:hypothetical protein
VSRNSWEPELDSTHDKTTQPAVRNLESQAGDRWVGRSHDPQSGFNPRSKPSRNPQSIHRPVVVRRAGPHWNWKPLDHHVMRLLSRPWLALLGTQSADLRYSTVRYSIAWHALCSPRFNNVAATLLHCRVLEDCTLVYRDLQKPGSGPKAWMQSSKPLMQRGLAGLMPSSTMAVSST